MKNGLLYFLFCLAALVSSCDGTNTRYHIGVSQCSYGAQNETYIED